MSAFALLLPVYAGNAPDELRAAFTSSVHEQTRRPDEVLVVVDGPVPPALDAELAELAASSPVPTRLLRLPANGGLAAALNAGLAEIGTEYVARMDADDVSHPERFARQLEAVETGGLDLLGSALQEFRGSPEVVVATRPAPVGAAAIRAAATWRQPFHHPTVVYRREAVLAAGGYPTDAGRIEDYPLFARMLVAGAKVDNLPEPLLSYRIDGGAYARRGGREQLRAELRLQRELRAIGLTSRGQWLRNVMLRGGYRLTPMWLRRRAYRAAALRIDHL